MKKLFCLFTFIFAFAPSFAQSEEPIDSLDIMKTVRERIEAQRVTEICGVKFGTSYETAKEMLENKYGDAEYNYSHSKQNIVFKNKKYAGILFDSIHFLFQSDGFQTYMNGCVFILDANSAEEAKEKRDFLYKRLSEKYNMLDGTDDNGFKYYVGGFSPVNNEDAAFVIDIIKYDKELLNYTSPYSARLMYGSYEFVKEEF